MGLFDKYNLLHVFMVILFVIGVLLLITAFTAYSKLGNTCTSGSLRTKLRWAIGLGTTFASLSIGYAICIYKSGASCQLGESADWKIYSMLVTLMGMGIGLVVLTNGIKSDLKEPGCSVDLGSTPDILLGIAICSIVIPVLYIVYIIKTGRPQGSKQVEEESDTSLKLKSDSKKTATDKRRTKRYDSLIAKKSEELSNVQDKIEVFESRGKKPNQADEDKAEMLINEIANAKQKRKEIGSSGSSRSSSSSSSSGSSEGLGNFGGLGNFQGIDDDEDE
jgi:uncharacterized membrane protein YgcG